jgi:hypothetical protein
MAESFRKRGSSGGIAVRHHHFTRRAPPLSILAFTLAATLAIGFARAERADLGTDRDAFTPCTHTVDKGEVLAELSYVYIDNLEGFPTNNYPESLFRIGATEFFEWRFGVNYGVGSQGNVVTSVEVGEGTLHGGTLYETSILYGFKVNTSKQDGWRPESAAIVEWTTPVYGDVFGTSPSATYIAGWELPASWRFDTAIRYARAEGIHHEWFDRWTPSVVLRMPLTDRFEVHTEWFGNFTMGMEDDFNQSFFAPGSHYILGKNLELGLRVGWGLSAEAAPFFSDLGVAFRY